MNHEPETVERFDELVRDALARRSASNKYDQLRDFLSELLDCPVDDVNATYCNPVSREFSARRGQAVSRARHVGLVLVEGDGEVAAAEERLTNAIAEGAWDGAGVVAAPEPDEHWQVRSVVEHPQRPSPLGRLQQVFGDVSQRTVAQAQAQPLSMPTTDSTEGAWTLSVPDQSAWEAVLAAYEARLADDAAVEALSNWEPGDVVAYYVEDDGFVGLLRVSSVRRSDETGEAHVAFTAHSEAFTPFPEPLRVDFDLPRYSTSFRIGKGDLDMGELDPVQVQHLKSVSQGAGSMTDRLTRAWFVLQMPESRYRDVDGEGYHFPGHIPNGKRVVEGDVLVCRSGGAASEIRIFGLGRLGEVILHEDGTRTGRYARYMAVDPALSLEDLGNDPRNSQQNSIQPFSMQLLRPILDHLGLSSIEDLPTATRSETASGERRTRGGVSSAATFDDLTLAHVQGIIDQSELVLPRHVVARCVAALRAGKHLLFTGPPGTGKTTLAQQLAQAAELVGLTSAATLATATADWTSADTVGGYWLNRSSRLEFRPGHVLRATEARSWLIIDELNRADIDKAFGQMFTVMSGQAVVLPYTENRQSAEHPVAIVPFGEDAPPQTHAYEIGPTWRILATLNTRDRDLLFSMSHALLRRFAIIDVDNPPHDQYRRLLREQASTGHRQLDAKIAALVTMPHRSLGPAILLDVAKYVRARLHLEAGPADVETQNALLREALFSFVLPQLDDLRVDQLRDIVGHVHRKLMGASDLSATLDLFTSGTHLPVDQLRPEPEVDEGPEG